MDISSVLIVLANFETHIYILQYKPVHNLQMLTLTCGQEMRTISTIFNPLRAKFFRGNINIYLHFVSFVHIDTTQVVEILPQIRQEPIYST